MEAYTNGRNDWKEDLAKAREFVSIYEREAAREKPATFLMKHNLVLASTYYYLAFGLCPDNGQRKAIAQEKGGIEAKLKELESDKPSYLQT